MMIPTITAKRIAATVSIAVTLSALTPIQAQTASPTPIYDNNTVRRVVVLDKIRGHLVVSRIDWDMAHYDLAMQQMADIPTELYSIIANDLKAAKLQDSFLAAENTCDQLIATASDKNKVHAAYDALIAVIMDARSAFAPAAAFNDIGFRLKVAQGLLTGVAEEYSEGVSGGQIVKLIGYQNAVGFLEVAQENYSAAQKAIQAQYPDLDKTVSAQYAILAQAMTPDLLTPARPADPQTLNDAITAIQTAEEQALGMPMVTARSVPEVIAAARAGLNDALNTYAAGSADDAYDLAASAYLDNFEGLEVTLRAKNATLTDLIESKFNQFDKLIKSGAKIDDLKALYAQIAANLDQAQALLVG